MAVNKNLVAAVGVAGLVLVIVAMNNKTDEKAAETPGGETRDELADAKQKLSSLERQYDDVLASMGDTPQEWHASSFISLQQQLHTLFREFDIIWQKRAARDITLSGNDPEQQACEDRAQVLEHSLEGALAEIRGEPQVFERHNYFDIHNVYAYAHRDGDEYTYVENRFATDARSVNILTADVSRMDFDQFGTEGQSRHALQDTINSIEESAGTAPREQSAFNQAAITQGAGGTAEDNDKSADRVNATGQNLPAAAQNAVPQPTLDERRGAPSIRDSRANFVAAPPAGSEPPPKKRKATEAPAKSRESQLQEDLFGAQDDRPLFVTDGSAGPDAGDLPSRIDGLNSKMDDARKNGDEATLGLLQRQMDTLKSQLASMPPTAAVEAWKTRVTQLQQAVSWYKGVSRQRRTNNTIKQLRTKFDLLQGQSPDKQGLAQNKGAVMHWDTVFALAKKDRDETMNDWGVKIRSRAEAGLPGTGGYLTASPRALRAEARLMRTETAQAPKRAKVSPETAPLPDSPRAVLPRQLTETRGVSQIAQSDIMGGVRRV